VTIQQILDTVRSFEGSLVLAPKVGSDYPEVAWGDYFLYYSVEGEVPERAQPYATIVTKNYPGDDRSDLDRAGRWRVNVQANRTERRQLLGHGSRDIAAYDLAASDVFMPHPVYNGWVVVVNPAARTTGPVIDLLRAAHDRAKTQLTRRADRSSRSRVAR
jgi:hypothetical protein